jgi:Rap1a immunity proteins
VPEYFVETQSIHIHPTPHRARLRRGLLWDGVMKRLVSAVLICVWSFVAHGEENVLTSGNSLLPTCKHAITDPRPADFETGLCLGLAAAFLNLQYDLKPPARFCPPEHATNGQVLEVVVAYMEAHPERLHKDIKTLFLDALTQAWPCKE